MNALPWILWNLLPFEDRLGRCDAVDIVSDWHSIDPDDQRLAASVAIFLKSLRTITTPDGLTVHVMSIDHSPYVVWTGTAEGRAELPQLVEAARTIMQADDPPGPVTTISARTEALAPIVATPAYYVPAQTFQPPRPRVVAAKPQAPRPQKAAPARQQFSLF